MPDVADVTKESCVLTWEAPEKDGGTPVIGYHMERCTGGSSRWIRQTKDLIPDTTFDVEDLIEDNTYEFRMVAVNKVGEGPPGPKSASITAKDPWGAYTCSVLFHQNIASKEGRDFLLIRPLIIWGSCNG